MNTNRHEFIEPQRSQETQRRQRECPISNTQCRMRKATAKINVDGLGELGVKLGEQLRRGSIMWFYYLVFGRREFSAMNPKHLLLRGLMGQFMSVIKI